MFIIYSIRQRLKYLFPVFYLDTISIDVVIQTAQLQIRMVSFHPEKKIEFTLILFVIRSIVCIQ